MSYPGNTIQAPRATLSGSRSSKSNSGNSRLRLSYRLLVPIVAIAESAIVIAASVIASFLFDYYWLQRLPDYGAALGAGVTAAMIYVLIACSWGLYGLPAFLDPIRHRGQVVTAWTLIVVVLTAIIFLLRLENSYSGGSMFTFGLLTLGFLLAARSVTTSVVKQLMARGMIAGREVVIIGDSAELDQISAPYLFSHFGLSEVARIALDQRQTTGLLSSESLSKLDDAMAVAREKNAREFVIALRWTNTALLNAVKERLLRSPLSARLIPDQALRQLIDRGSISGVRSALSVQLQYASMSMGQQFIKRTIDILAASIVLLILSPLLLVVAIAIKLDTPGPIIFRQRRNGFNGRQFVIFKFRTMKVLEDGPQIIQARHGDPRVSRVGRLLRRTSLDELPQLANVVIGDMSLVGPRPHALAHDGEYTALIADYAFRQHVKPGMTGLAQINGLRGETSNLRKMKERVAFDLWYIRHWSIWLDLWILIRTPLEVIKAKAY